MTRVSRAIGRAADFYRLRVLVVDATEAVDFDWREDILYRRPAAEWPEERNAYRVEAVLSGDGSDDVVTVLAQFADEETAQEWFADCREDLEVMTRSEFEARYFAEL